VRIDLKLVAVDAMTMASLVGKLVRGVHLMLNLLEANVQSRSMTFSNRRGGSRCLVAILKFIAASLLSHENFMCWYIARGAVAEQHLLLANNRNVTIVLKIPCDDVASLFGISSIGFIGRLAALVS
jgi:hypothetical protein